MVCLRRYKQAEEAASANSNWRLLVHLVRSMDYGYCVFISSQLSCLLLLSRAAEVVIATETSLLRIRKQIVLKTSGNFEERYGTSRSINII